MSDRFSTSTKLSVVTFAGAGTLVLVMFFLNFHIEEREWGKMSDDLPGSCAIFVGTFVGLLLLATLAKICGNIVFGERSSLCPPSLAAVCGAVAGFIIKLAAASYWFWATLLCLVPALMMIRRKQDTGESWKAEKVVGHFRSSR